MTNLRIFESINVSLSTLILVITVILLCPGGTSSENILKNLIVMILTRKWKFWRVDYGFKGEVFLRNGNGILLPNNQFGSSIYKLKTFSILK